jgi:hypothetical protein
VCHVQRPAKSFVRQEKAHGVSILFRQQARRAQPHCLLGQRHRQSCTSSGCFTCIRPCPGALMISFKVSSSQILAKRDLSRFFEMLHFLQLRTSNNSDSDVCSCHTRKACRNFTHNRSVLLFERASWTPKFRSCCSRTILMRLFANCYPSRTRHHQLPHSTAGRVSRHLHFFEVCVDLRLSYCCGHFCVSISIVSGPPLNAWTK